MRIGVLGGTFDPPHLAHLVLAAAARQALTLDRVVLVPAGDPWRKAGSGVSPAAERLALTRAAVEGVLPWAEVSEIEVRREGPSYTAETLEELQAEFPGNEWWFILGWDALADLPNWHEPERIIELARLALAQRGGESTDGALPPETVAALPGLAARVDRVPLPRLDVSASELRRRLREGEETAPLLPAGVRELIAARGLYGA
ncbi:MAG: nicotinate (nicotinamide) nucleotide adenylyltransferase [Chloroflexi bacterium]|nr:nicotinate (nicotinamide) nucleotide adenylyltransferase [Chloroflexota bacterium]